MKTATARVLATRPKGITMKALIASVFALGLIGASANSASALTIHISDGHHHHHRHCTSWGWHHHHHDRYCRGWGW